MKMCLVVLLTNMKRIVFFLTILLLSVSITSSNASSNIKIIYDCEDLEIPTEIINHRTMAPLEDICAALGIELDFDLETYQIVVRKDGIELKLAPNNPQVIINGVQSSVDSTPTRINNKIYVPIVFMAQTFNFETVWDPETSTLQINNPLFPISVNGKYGFINKKGEIVIEPQYDNILIMDYEEGATMGFHNGYAPVKVKDKWGFINVKGEFIAEPKYDKVNFFKDNRAAVYIYDEQDYRPGFYQPYRHTYIRPDGTEITDFIFSDGYINNQYWEGVAIVAYNGKRRFIDRDGNFLLNEDYTPLSYCAGGLVQAEWTEKGKRVKGFVSPDGNNRISLDGAAPSYGFSNDRASIKLDVSPTYRPKYKHGVIDRNGRVVVKPIYDYIKLFTEGYAAVELNYDWGFIDLNGNYLVEPKYSAISNFSEGMAAVCDGHKFGFINSKGEMVIQPAYDCTDYFKEGYARVNVGTTWWYRDQQRMSTIGGKWGFIDKEGNLVIDTVFDYVNPFYKGIAGVFVYQYGYDLSKAKIGYIDKQGKWVWEPTK